ncbi:flagellar biosynthesis protein FlgN [Pseudooceanicola sp. C21-150M6]|uniref:flagellar biosynthesis protein FlgN n=1 Tax=Pseudooceanicola sp. C21-150M6 TaxID=3434355 RepID=UPI003D7F855F
MKELDALLDRERLALLEGDFSGISDLVSDKEHLLEELGRLQRPDRKILNILQEKAKRNHLLLENAMQGIRSVADRFEAMRNIREALETYDGSGRKTLLPAPAESRVEKRA